MNRPPIISQTEALQILRNDLRHAALKKRAAELQDATAEMRASVLAEIERQIEAEISRRKKISPLKKFFSIL